MKILIVHNAYQHRGGEDAVVDAEVALLRSQGHELIHYQKHNDALSSMSKATAAATTIWSRSTIKEAGKLCEDFRPDVIHAHNTFPLVSPSLYWMASKRRVPIVQTLHNFRLLCPQAIFLREGRICEECIGKLPWRAIVHKCYRQSRAQTAVLTGMLATHRALGTFQERVTRYIALTEFAKNKYIAGGLPANRFRIKPNFVEAPSLPTEPPQVRQGGLYVGRLSLEKGLDVLAAAKQIRPESRIDIVGSGPLEATAQTAFGTHCLGQRSLQEILQRMRAARYLVLPSICYENAPRTIVEAYASGLPVIASRLGALIDIVRDGVTGLLFDPGDAQDLARKLAWADNNPDAMQRMGRAARAEYEAKYTPQQNYALLMDIYEDAISATIDHAAGRRVRHAGSAA